MPKVKRTIDALNLSDKDMVQLMKSMPQPAADSDSPIPLTLEWLEATGLAKAALDRIFAAADQAADTANEVTEALIHSTKILLAFAEEQQDLSSSDDTPSEIAKSCYTSVDAIITYVKLIQRITEISMETANSAISIMNECVTMMDEDEDEVVTEIAAPDQAAASVA